MFIQICGMWLAMIGMTEHRLPSLAAQATKHAEAGDFEKAIDAWSILLAVAPEQEAFWFGRGVAHGVLGHTEAMHRDMAQCFKLYPADALAEYLFIDDEDDSGEAEAEFKALIKKHPRCAPLLCAYGNMLVNQERYKEGQALLDLSIRYKPRNNVAYLIRAALMAQLDKSEQAEQDLRRYQAWKPDDSHVQITQVYLQEMKAYYRRITAQQYDQEVKERAGSDRAVLDLKQSAARWDQVIQRNSDVRLADADDVETIDSRYMEIPITLTSEIRQRATVLTLYVSSNRGKDWQKVATALPTDKHFNYAAPADGLYWFGVTYLTQEGSQVPGTIAGLQPQLKIKINTSMTYQKKADPPKQIVASSSESIALPSSMLPPKK